MTDTTQLSKDIQAYAQELTKLSGLKKIEESLSSELQIMLKNIIDYKTNINDDVKQKASLQQIQILSAKSTMRLAQEINQKTPDKIDKKILTELSKKAAMITVTANKIKL